METEGAMRLKLKLAKWAAIAVLSIGAAAPALGGSVTRPGEHLLDPSG
jgi:hypothetical protein